jgi:hypothetical protein
MEAVLATIVAGGLAQIWLIIEVDINIDRNCDVLPLSLDIYWIKIIQH